MKPRIFFFLFFFVIFSGYTQLKNAVEKDSLQPPAEIAGLITELTKEFPNQTQLSLAILKDGTTAFYGVLKNDNQLTYLQNQQKVFEIGSLTKVFTSTVLAVLAEEGKLDLKDEINSFYPFEFKDDIRITFKSLANQTSGLPRLPGNLNLFSDMNNPYKNYTEKDLNEYLQHSLILLKPNAYEYSNLGVGLLGHSLGLVVDGSFEELLQTHIFDPLGMTQTYTSSEDLKDELVQGLNPMGKPASNWDFEVLAGAGSILSTTEDLAKFALAQFNPENKAMALTRQSTFVIDDNMEIGLGWHLIKTAEKDLIYWHNGGTGGYSSSMIVDPNTKTSVIILSNVSGLHPQMGKIDQLCFQILKNLEKD